MAEKCFFCGSEDILLPEVGIALEMGGDDYSFCKKCLQEKSAEGFWKEFFENHNYTWPPILREPK